MSAPEQSLRQAFQERRQVPDVLVVFQGLRTAIEGKVADKPDAETRVLEQARNRVATGIAHIGVAVLYPAAIRRTPFPDLQGALGKASLKIAVCSEAGESGWTEGDLPYLASLLRRTFEQLVQEDIVAKAVNILNEGIGEFAKATFTNPAVIAKAATILGIGEPPKKKRKAAEDEEE